MQKIILDTNVIVSSLIQKNYLYLIIYHCIEGNTYDFRIKIYNGTKILTPKEYWEEYKLHKEHYLQLDINPIADECKSQENLIILRTVITLKIRFEPRF